MALIFWGAKKCKDPRKDPLEGPMTLDYLLYLGDDIYLPRFNSGIKISQEIRIPEPEPGFHGSCHVRVQRCRCSHSSVLFPGDSSCGRWNGSGKSNFGGEQSTNPCRWWWEWKDTDDCDLVWSRLGEVSGVFHWEFFDRWAQFTNHSPGFPLKCLRVFQT